MVDTGSLETKLDHVVRQRLASTESERLDTLSLAGHGLRFEAELTAQRRQAALRRAEADIFADGDRLAGAELAKGPRNNFIPVSFLEAGALAGRPVARVSLFGGRKTGTGFLISPDLFLTNFHVVPDPEIATNTELEFDFETDLAGRDRNRSVFRLDTSRCFIVDDIDGLDYCVVAIGPAVTGNRQLGEFGFNPLSGSGSKHALGEFANIIQHPDGRPKEVVLQDNLIAGRHEKALHYVADTEPGSSGSPVFNNAWQVIALHHWGVVKDIETLDGSYRADSVNEGIRISRIVTDLLDRQDMMHDVERRLIHDALEIGSSYTPEQVSRRVRHAAPPAPSMRSNDDGTVTWQVPVEITVGIPGLASTQSMTSTASPSLLSASTDSRSPHRPSGPEARTVDELIASGGYDPSFLPGASVPLPALLGDSLQQAVELKPGHRTAGKLPYELVYTHFSVVMNRARKMAMLTAVNIDGQSLFGLKRGTNQRYLYDDNRIALNARRAEMAEGSGWFFDKRIPRDLQTGAPFYDVLDNNTLVSPKNKGFKETENFERGHIVRRLDPIWGTLEEGIAADADSHAWTNVAPQTKVFNANNRDANDVSPGEEKRLWAAAENAILRTAFDDRKRLSVFSGPVFGDDDPVYAGLPDNAYQRRVPLAFWKVICWMSPGGLRSLALLIEQKKTLQKPTGAEALDDPAELLALRDYLTTVPKIEEKIEMRFDDVVRDGDVWRRHADKAVADLTGEEFFEIIVG